MESPDRWLDGPIVVPLDGREASVRALYFAEGLAHLSDAPLRLISVVDREDQVEARLAWITDATQDALGDVQPEVDVLVGSDVVGTIVDAVAASGVVCMATAGKVTFHSGHFGSIAEGVVRKLGRPVVLVGPHVDPRPPSGTGRVVVPVDGSKLSTAALGPAADLAAVLDVPLWITSIVSPSDVAVTSATHNAPIEARQFEVMPKLAAQVAADRGMTVEHEVINSESPDHAIVEFAGDDGIVVMSTHGRSGLSRFFAGSIATGVVAHSHRPVVVLRPASD